MSVWKTVQNNTMDNNVDMSKLEKALESLGAKLDFSVTTIRNSWGEEECLAAIYNVERDMMTALGIRKTETGGIELVGDTWNSGFAGDQKQDELINKIAQQYNKELYTEKLNEMGYTITSNTVNAKGEIELVAITY